MQRSGGGEVFREIIVNFRRPLIPAVRRNGRNSGRFAWVFDSAKSFSLGGAVDIYNDTIRDLGPAEKLRLVEQIWDDLAAEVAPLPVPTWAVTEAARRRDEMLANPKLGSTDEVVWKRINDLRNG